LRRADGSGWLSAMPLFRRPDGKLARGVPATRRIMPYMMRGRNESMVYFEQRIDLGKTLPFVVQPLADRPATHEPGTGTAGYL